MPDKQISIVIADDHHVVRQGIARLLELEDDMVILAQADNGRRAFELIEQHAPDVALLDLNMPRGDGLETLDKIQSRGLSTGVAILTSFSGELKISQAIESGALGFMLKDIDGDELLAAVRKVACGGYYIQPEVAAKLALGAAKQRTGEALTRRETEILALLGQGLSNQAIADELFISLKTVKVHVSNLLSKLKLSDRTQAAIYAVKNEFA
ncbi:response regulator transcription factor [Thalassomonas viridans]|uniref:Response regulator transcription factor n=1 Tax=Thalassomonas viridans TaxID=137584 RepID=A0AAE9YXL6_9GAMM|nr:response regulator transcription factor [Thalassomonas viridans]WDE03101.1 response regulator transcription factor [Thalassomonas viridans]